MNYPTVLIIEDETRIAHWVRTYFERAGFHALVAEDGMRGLEMALSEKPDTVILDLMLPGMGGLAVCRALRNESNVPIIILTARGSEQDRILGLELGADDYVVKPFSPGELVARVQAVLRRSQGEIQTEPVLRLNGVELNIAAHTCLVDGYEVTLSRTQFNLLAVLMQNDGRVLTRQQLLGAAFNDEAAGFERTIDVHIRRLRKQIETDPSQPQRIRTVYGVGYKFERE
ncbi:MAG: response regulator transcription factor [Anaerolineaceae bacterium]|nr:response regulator transcription factor [Anaerolineaceae bacterium]